MASNTFWEALIDRLKHSTIHEEVTQISLEAISKYRETHEDTVPASSIGGHTGRFYIDGEEVAL